jgi:hypothetical protein
MEVFAAHTFSFTHNTPQVIAGHRKGFIPARATLATFSTDTMAAAALALVLLPPLELFFSSQNRASPKKRK